jgi:predicted nucleotidyltransferase
MLRFKVIDATTINCIAKRLQAAAPEAKLFLFGSYARGDARDASDLDFLIVEPGLPAARSEKTHLRKILGALDVKIDLLVVGEAVFQEWLKTPGMLEAKPSPPGAEIKAINFCKRIRDFLTERAKSGRQGTDVRRAIKSK